MRSSRETLLRLHRFRTEEKRRQVADIEAMIADLMRKYDDLDAQIKIEEQRTGVTDPAHFNYSMAAKSTRGRRDNLLKTVGDLKDQQAAVQALLQKRKWSCASSSFWRKRTLDHRPATRGATTGFAPRQAVSSAADHARDRSGAPYPDFQRCRQRYRREGSEDVGAKLKFVAPQPLIERAAPHRRSSKACW